MPRAVIVSAVRTPTGKLLGALKDVTAAALGTIAVAEAVRRARVDGAIVDECIMGNVVTAGEGQNPARQAALGAGLPHRVGAVTVNKVCGSGLKAVMLADQAIRAGDIEVAVAGGMESASQAPYLARRVREGLRLGHGELVDAAVSDGLWCAFEQCHMGMAGEVVAERYKVSRRAQDEYAEASHRKAAHATESGAFADEIVAVTVPRAKGQAVVVDRDEPIRADTTLDALGRLTPAFKKDGTVTAGNAPGINDGAAAVVVMSEARARELGLAPLARIVAQATSGVEPALVLMSPVDAVRRVLQRAGWAMSDVDLFEINEAFAVQMVAVIHELGLDANRVNINGGAIALGHAIGSSGARILTTLVHAMKSGGHARGVAALCLGGGNGVALAVERI